MPYVYLKDGGSSQVKVYERKHTDLCLKWKSKSLFRRAERLVADDTTNEVECITNFLKINACKRWMFNTVQRKKKMPSPRTPNVRQRAIGLPYISCLNNWQGFTFT